MRGLCDAVALFSGELMASYNNPYRDYPESAPLTRTGRLAECVLSMALALLAFYLSR